MAEHPCERCGMLIEGRRKYCSDDCRSNRGEMGPNLAAAERTIAKLRDSGQLEQVDDATVQAFLSLAAAVDQPEARADMWREYRSAGAALREAAAGAADDDTQAFLISIQTPSRAEVRHTTKS